MRGKAAETHAAGFRKGITPAYAGKSSDFSNRKQSLGDHPRLCGEKHLTCDGVAGVYGSPPPMRGKASSGTAVSRCSRITPAYAGKSRPEATVR